MDEQKRWRWMEVGVVFCSLFLFDFVNAANSYFNQEYSPRGFWTDFIYLVARSLQAVVLILFLIHSSADSWKSFGFVKPRLVDAGKGFVVMLIASFGGAALQVFLYGFAFRTMGEIPNYPRTGLEAASGWLLPFALFAIVANSLAEEFAARSFLITRFEQLYNSRFIAVLFSSVLFASYHIYQGLIPMVGIFFVGIVYGIAFVRTRNIWVVVFAHAFSLVLSFAPSWIAMARQLS